MHKDEIWAARIAAHRLRSVLHEASMDLDDARQEALISIWLRGHTAPEEAGEHRTQALIRLGRLGIIDALRKGGGRRFRSPITFTDDEWLDPEAPDNPERTYQLKQAVTVLERKKPKLMALAARLMDDGPQAISESMGVSDARVSQIRGEIRAHFEKHL